MNLLKLQFVLLLLVCAVVLRAQKPNIVIIHTDEHNFRTLSCYREQMSQDQAYVWGKGLGVETPNIDRIANEGAICMNYYATSPVCGPSRASMMTGLYRQGTGVIKNGMDLRHDVPTFSQILKENGYATSYLGKWHLEEAPKYTFNIQYKAGWEDNTYMMSGGHNPYFHVTADGVKALNAKRYKDFPQDEVVHLTDYFVDKTLDVLERDKDKPFCVMVSIPDPHTPDYAKPPYHTMYDDMDLQMPKTMTPEYADIRPIWALGEKTEAKGFNVKALRQYFGMVKHIDDRVGDILQFLDDNNLVDNTIVVFTSDHGDMFFEHKKINKGISYEGSTKIPYVVRYPNKIPAGKVIRKAYTNADFAPTLIEMAGLKTQAKFDGEATAKDFFNKEQLVVDDRIVHMAEANQIWVGAVSRKYKLILTRKTEPWLFDLQRDPDEVVNYYKHPEYKAAAKEMMSVLKARMKQFDEPILDPKYKLIYE
ncbi:sulfatase-like hydrolase/transferase [Saccharicrinis aurantiacus]|uniref:sulfatase-like hydrolase/transferase n=1 Tax=Saccharicrinis aurantiacus TaxID=1849719 RepID=UPI00094F598B|nr:sulfatase-like hydrolase/transferase [Saccharicrinis aurantiacus]